MNSDLMLLLHIRVCCNIFIIFYHLNKEYYDFSSYAVYDETRHLTYITQEVQLPPISRKHILYDGIRVYCCSSCIDESVCDSALMRCLKMFGRQDSNPDYARMSKNSFPLFIILFILDLVYQMYKFSFFKYIPQRKSTAIYYVNHC